MEYSVQSESISNLPTKRLFDGQLQKVKEVTKLQKEFSLETNEVLFKIKLIGINYSYDFEPLKLRPDIGVVPGNKFMGKIYSYTEGFDDDKNILDYNQKYLVFPYTNCIQQNRIPCTNCDKFSRLPCLEKLEFGFNIDGGLQDFIKIKNPLDGLIQIPYNVSSHDAIFSIDVMLPFYSSYQEILAFNKNFSPNKDKILVIINDTSKELNDILLVIRLLNLNENLITIFDVNHIANFSQSELDYYKSYFNHCFVFNFKSTSVDFALHSVITTGLESTKSRYNVIFLDQYHPITQQNFQVLKKAINDKTLFEFHLQWYHKPDLIDLLDRISVLNTGAVTADYGKPPTSSSSSSRNRPSLTSIESSQSTFSNTNISSHLDSSHSLNYLNSAPIPSKPKKGLSWLWYEKDYYLSNDYNKLDDNSLIHSIRKINRLVYMTPKPYLRVCYNNKLSQSKKVNAFIFS